MDWEAIAYTGSVLVTTVLLLSLVACVLYAWDKRRAQRGGWRVSESALHMVELLGGWPGALLASKLFRHKSRKASYRVVRAMCVALHVLAVTVLLAWVGTR